MFDKNNDHSMSSLIWRQSLSAVRPNHDLDAIVFFISEGLVGLWAFFERDPMGDDEGRIDLAFNDQVQKWSEVLLHVRRAGFDRQRFGDDDAHRHGNGVDEYAA